MARVIPALLAAQGLAGALATLSAQQPGIDVQSYAFEVSLPDTGSAITGHATIVFRRTGRADTLHLDLVGMTVDAVSRPHAYDGRTLAVELDPGRRGLDSVGVTWHGTAQDGLIIRDNARGRWSAFGDNWPNRARHWLPTADHPSDKASVRWEIDAPGRLRVIANGRLAGRDALRSPRVRWTYVEPRPIPTYTMVLGATEMTVSRHRPLVSMDGDTVPVEVWTYPEDSAFADGVPFRRATAILEVMERLIGPYPYGSLAHVQSSTRYGGMENSTAIFYAERGYVRRTMGEGVVRHETAHQWFGDAVTPRAWADVWISEGFATYFDAVIAAALDGDSALARLMRGHARTVLDAPVVRERPVIDTAETDPNRLLNANSYPKGAWILHMLRGEVGDSAFFRGLREYYRRYRDSSVTTSELRQVMEESARTDLGWFFEQWLRRPGYPQLEVAWRPDPASRRVHLTIRQVQPEAWGRFRLPRLTVDLELEGGRTARREVALDPRVAEQVASFAVEGMPREVVVDPDGALLVSATVRP